MVQSVEEGCKLVLLLFTYKCGAPELSPLRSAPAPVFRLSFSVLPLLLRGGEDLVGVLYLIEALLGAEVSGVRIRVVLAYQLPVSFADVVLGSSAIPCTA
jgi:hypothetical protein